MLNNFVVSLIFLILIESISFARCSKGYSSVDLAVKNLRSYIGEEAWSTCKDIALRTKGNFAIDHVRKSCIDTKGSEVEINVFEIIGGICKHKEEKLYVAVTGMYTFELGWDLDPN